MRIAFGVNDIPYVTTLPVEQKRNLRWRLKRKAWQPAHPSLMTTGDVAEILEHRYHIFEHFYRMNSDSIGDAITEAMRAHVESALMGAPRRNDEPALPEGALSKVEERFRQFLDNRELDGVAPGVPTQAAQKGHNARLAHPYAKGNPPRPSFIMSGTYQANARVWVTE